MWRTLISGNTDDEARHGRSLLHCLDHAAQSVEIQEMVLLCLLLSSEKAATSVNNNSRLHSVFTGHIPSAYHTA